MTPDEVQLEAARIGAEAARMGAAFGAVTGVVVVVAGAVMTYWLTQRSASKERFRLARLAELRETMAAITAVIAWLQRNYSLPRADRASAPDLSQWPLASWRYLGDVVLLKDFLQAEFIMGMTQANVDLPNKQQVATMLSVPYRCELAIARQRARALRDEPLQDMSESDYEAALEEHAGRYMRPVNRPVSISDLQG